MTDYDVHAERAVLAAAIQGNAEAFVTVPPEAFTHWISQELASAIRQTISKGIPVELPTVVRHAVAAVGGGTRGAEINTAAVDLLTWPVIGASEYHAERITTLLATRQLTYALETAKRLTEYATENDDATVRAEALKDARTAMERFESMVAGPVEQAPPDSVGDVLAETDEPHNWLVPGLLERMDRLILTGFEGTGKSYLLAQLALTVAAGLHPFTTDPLPDGQYRTLVLDAENSRNQIRRRYRRIVAQIDTLRSINDLGPVNWKECARLVIRPEGFDLTDPSEMARIVYAIESTSPDLVVAGPLYKMSRLNIQEEQAAQELTLTLDHLRAKYGFTLICEAHAGHTNDGGGMRKVRPIGSSLFLRWPEFGFGIVPHPDDTSEHPETVLIKHWRGSREERDWPDVLKHGDMLPWEVADTAYYERVRKHTS